MAMKRCPDCGEKYSDTYKYCPFCEEEEILKKGKTGGRRARQERSWDENERLQLADRIRLLQAMQREARELAALTEHYYERGYWRNVKYTL